MAASPCVACGAEVQDTYLCTGCTDDLRDQLYRVRALEDDLEISLSRMANNGGQDTGVRSRSAETALPFSWSAAEALYGLTATLCRWSVAVAAVRNADATPVPALVTRDPKDPARVRRRRSHAAEYAAWLAEHVSWVATHPDANACLDECLDAVRQAVHAIDRAPEMAYAGPCWAVLSDTDSGVEDQDNCPAELYARASAAAVVCPECGAEWAMDERRRWLLTAVRSQLVTATEASRALPGLLGAELSSSAIRGLVHRGRILQHPPLPGSRIPLYNVGELIDAVVASQVEASSRKGRRRAG